MQKSGLLTLQKPIADVKEERQEEQGVDHAINKREEEEGEGNSLNICRDVQLF